MKNDRVDPKALRRELLKARRSQLSEEPLRHTFRARHRALIAGHRQAEARRVESAWLEACAAYRAAKDSAPPDDADAIDANGLTLLLPRAASASRHATRLRDGSLPWRDILAQRELGLGRAMLDVGADVGTTSLLRVVAGDVQCVYAIEPEPANYRCLVQNIVANGLGGFVLPDSCAISSRTGQALLRQASGLGAHRLMSDKAFRRGRRDTLVVETLTLDDWIRERSVEPDALAFVKVDTQGWESHVLAGAERLLTRHHLAWVLEVSPRHLSAAGTPLPQLLAQLQRHFTHAIDLRPDHSKNRVISVTQLPEALGYLDERDGPHTYTNLVLYHQS